MQKLVKLGKSFNDTGCDPIALGVIGLGRGFALTAPTLKLDPRIKVAAGSDPRPNAQAQFRRDFDCNTFSSVEELCKQPNLDAIYIASPHEYHKDHAVQALMAGKHVLVDKPMAISVQDCDAMVLAAEASGKHLIIGPSHGFDPQIDLVRSLIASEDVGAVKMISAQQYTDYIYRPRRPEEFKRELGGGVIFGQATHHLDTFQVLAGSPIRKVYAAIGNWDEGRKMDGAYSLFLKTDSGVFGTLTYSGYGHFDSDELMGWTGELGFDKNPEGHRKDRPYLRGESELAAKHKRGYGEANEGLAVSNFEQSPPAEHFGHIVVTAEKADLLPRPNGVEVYSLSERKLHPLPAQAAARSGVITELWNAIHSNEAPLHDGNWGRHIIKVCHAIVQSAETHAEITVED